MTKRLAGAYAFPTLVTAASSAEADIAAVQRHPRRIGVDEIA